MYGTPSERAETARNAFLFVIQIDRATIILIMTDIGGVKPMLGIVAAPKLNRSTRASINAPIGLDRYGSINY